MNDMKHGHSLVIVGISMIGGIIFRRVSGFVSGNR